MKVVVVGTSHAGYEAVQTLLQEVPDAEIHLYERGSTMGFLSCGIQSFLEGKSDSLDDLHYATSSSFEEQGVHAYTNAEVVSINADDKTVTVKTEDGEKEESYDKLFLSPGAVPIEIPIPGADLEHVYYLRGRDWAEVVDARMKDAKKAVIVGGGYIGIEVAEAFTKAGIDTTVLDAQASILPTYLDEEFTDVLIEHAKDKGMKFHGNEGVQEIVGEDGKVSKVVTDKGEYEADTVVMAVGVRPDTGWLDGILEKDEKGFVEVNEYQESSEKDIYVAGDATKIPFAPAHDRRSIALASNARRQGVIAAKNIAAGENKYKMPEVSGTSGLTLFDYHFAATGVKDVDADTLDVEVDSKYMETVVLPKFMKDDTKVAMKIHFEKDSHRIVGAQIMSTEDFTESMNVMSVVISANYTLEDLALQDFFFQPEYGNTWHHLNKLAQAALDEPFGSQSQLF